MGKRETPSKQAPIWFRPILLSGLKGGLALCAFALSVSPAQAAVWNLGDVFAAVGGGKYNVYSGAGVFKETIDIGTGGFTTGCAFNATRTKIYTTDFSAGKVVVFDAADPHAILQTITTGDTSPESMVFDGAGNFYVGHADGSRTIKKFNSAGNPIGTFSPTIGPRGTDWIELAADGCTMFYTSEGGLIRRFNVCTNTQLPDFASIGGVSFALRLLSPFDGSGGLLVANSTTVKRLNGSGAVVQSYDAGSENAWFSLSLDPNGTSFWSGSFDTGNFYRFNISSGTVEVGPIVTGSSAVFGICVSGEITGVLVAAIPTLSEWAMIGMTALLVGFGLWTLRWRNGLGGRPA